MTNPFIRIARAHRDVPEALRRVLVTHDVKEAIPFVGTVDAFVETYTPTKVCVSLAPRRGVENHIGGMHAAALALLAETASGLVVALNVTEPGVPLLRSMDVDFRRPARGRVTATARLDDATAARISERPIGKVDVEVVTDDESGEAPVESTLQWAWLPASKIRG